MTLDASVSRTMWEAVERFHGLTYLAPEVREEGAAAGLKGFWMNYFATRIAPVGAVGPEVVQSTFFYYAPSRVHRAIPDAWTFSSPPAVIDARYRGMQRALGSTYDAEDTPALAEADSLVKQAVQACDPIGRLLYTGWAALEWPEDPALSLWHGCTLLREYRSGNHLIALCTEGLTGIESIVSHVAADGAPSEWIQDEAGWLPENEAAAVESLRARGWLDDVGNATDELRAGRTRIEQLTDTLDLPIWTHLGQAKGQRLFDLMSGLVQRLPLDDQLDWKQIYGDNLHR